MESSNRISCPPAIHTESTTRSQTRATVVSLCPLSPPTIHPLGTCHGGGQRRRDGRMTNIFRSTSTHNPFSLGLRLISLAHGRPTPLKSSLPQVKGFIWSCILLRIAELYPESAEASIFPHSSPYFVQCHAKPSHQWTSIYVRQRCRRPPLRSNKEPKSSTEWRYGTNKENSAQGEEERRTAEKEANQRINK